MPESKTVAEYYAGKRRLKARGVTPAVLLVYGIPLLVNAADETASDKAFKDLASARAREYQELVLQMVRELDRLLGIPGPSDKSSRRLTIPPSQVLKMAERSLDWAIQYLGKEGAREGEKPTKVKVLSLLIRLRGTSPEARAMAERMAKGSAKERELIQSQELLGWNAVMRQGLDEQMFTGILPETALETAAAVRFSAGVIGEWQFWAKAQTLYEKPRKLAAVDSELTVALRDAYQVPGWLPNPFNFAYDRLPFIKEIRQQALMVCRLDGPSPEIAKRLVDDALETEKTGLKGNLYIDARGLKGKGEYGSYDWYDRHLLELYDLMKNSSQKVIIDQTPQLFPLGSCPDAALYVGWYSLGKYVASCKWQKGAVAYHVASTEATTLKKPGSNVWCKRMLEEGVAATLGPVAEPYLNSFPLPDQFFPLLLSGKLALLEVYFRTLPHVSWMQILIGDPLYTPFKQNPVLLTPESRKRIKK
ncbi:MAG: TIGR03790 family protein [Deltaproteobacteria bacterium]|nr:TIGR03790 family protein [Deltaproteobacteria bacterium]